MWPDFAQRAGRHKRWLWGIILCSIICKYTRETCIVCSLPPSLSHSHLLSLYFSVISNICCVMTLSLEQIQLQKNITTHLLYFGSIKYANNSNINHNNVMLCINVSQLSRWFECQSAYSLGVKIVIWLCSFTINTLAKWVNREDTGGHVLLAEWIIQVKPRSDSYHTRLLLYSSLSSVCVCLCLHTCLFLRVTRIQ